MPENFDTITFIRRAVYFTFSIEAAGALVLYIQFIRAGVESPLWSAIFHSVSAFCTAGFSIFPNNLESFHDDIGVNVVISVLSLLGAVGFIVMGDIYLTILHRKKSLTLTSEIILFATFGGLALGTMILFFDSSLGHLPLVERLLASAFQSISAQTTAGFNTQPIGALSSASIMLMLVLMITGASPSGTGGGLKSTSWSAGLAATWSAIRGRKNTTFFGHTVPYYRIQTAFASFTLYLLVFSAGCYLLLAIDNHRFEDVIFEASSALGTVGLSRGITGDLSSATKCVLIVLMYIGRVGVISLGLAAMAKSNDESEPVKHSDLAV